MLEMRVGRHVDTKFTPNRLDEVVNVRGIGFHSPSLHNKWCQSSKHVMRDVWSERV